MPESANSKKVNGFRLAWLKDSLVVRNIPVDKLANHFLIAIGHISDTLP